MILNEHEKIIHSPIKNLKEDDDLVWYLLEAEIGPIIQFPLNAYLAQDPNALVIHYLIDYRSRRPITKRSIDSFPFTQELFLQKPLRKLGDNSIFRLCLELAVLTRSGVENMLGTKLYVFLDRQLDRILKKKRAPRGHLACYKIL